MNIKIYQQVEDDKVIEESLFNVIKIEESDDFGYVFTMLDPWTNEVITREIPKGDVMWLQINVILKAKFDPITDEFVNDITELKESVK